MRHESITLAYIVVAMLISQIAAVCRNRPDGFFVADASDRRSFFWCYDGEAHHGTCPDDLVFFEETQVCNKNQDPCVNQPNGRFVADPTDRRRFYWCYDGEGHPNKCPDNLIFFEDAQVCNNEVTTARPGPPPVPTNRPNVGPCKNIQDGLFVSDPTDRRRFYWCNGGEAFPGKCDDGEYFFEKGQYCDAEVVTTKRPVPSPRPPPPTTARPVPTARPPPGTTTRSAGPPIPTRLTTGGAVRTTTRAGRPPIPQRTTTTASGRPPIPTRQPQGK